MGKLKTHKGVAKRFRLTKKGKLKFGTCGKSHLLTGKTSSRKRHLRKAGIITHQKEARYLKKMLPYG